ncbi:MAG: type I-E CRISPR-associated endoribonuclease Cas2e [Candidatus Cloacimonetes bacterium]|nr:type I-E CRISPR-associated endoribonuclease Cas2e [Candidatus Cloacimonadota bacterium]
MIVIIMENVPAGLKGELTRWLMEIKSGVFVGQVSARVREMLWRKVRNKSQGGPCILLTQSKCEQGFEIEFWGSPSRVPTNWEGLQLITKPKKP